MIPSPGRIVLYKLSEQDVKDIAYLRSKAGGPHGNHADQGSVYPAMIVRTWGGGEGSAVNLKIFLDGQDELWVTSRTEGDHDGGWSVPPRV